MKPLSEKGLSQAENDGWYEVVKMMDVAEALKNVKIDCNNKSTVDTDNTIKIWDLFKILDKHFGDCK